MRDETPAKSLDPYLDAARAEADLNKAKAAMAWLTSFWIIVGPPTAFITWLAIR